MKLKQYQEQLIDKALAVLYRHRLVYLAMETRTGKTPVSLLTAARIAQDIDTGTITFITKKSVIPSIEKAYCELSPNYPELARINLEVISMDSIHHLEKKPRVLIVDEAHSFGAYPKPSQRAKSLRAVSQGCIVIYLSATPTPESYSQIYHQLWAAHSTSGLVYGYDTFYKWAQRFVSIKQKRIAAGRSINDYSFAHIEMIKPYLDELSVSITQAEAGFAIHEVKEHVYPIEMPPEIAQAIKSITKDQLCTINGITITAPTAAAKMSKIHQLCSGSIIADDGNGMIVSRHKAGKIKFLLNLYSKLAIYYKYIQEREMLIEVLGTRATESPEEFEASQDKVFIGQYLSKREGINLYSADAIVMFNIDFAYVSYVQTKNRIINMNREKPAHLIWLFTKGGIEEKIHRQVSKKKNFTETYFRRIYK